MWPPVCAWLSLDRSCPNTTTTTTTTTHLFIQVPVMRFMIPINIKLHPGSYKNYPTKHYLKKVICLIVFVCVLGVKNNVFCGHHYFINLLAFLYPLPPRLPLHSTSGLQGVTSSLRYTCKMDHMSSLRYKNSRKV